MDKDLKDIKSFDTKSGTSSTKSGSSETVVKRFDSAPAAQTVTASLRSAESFAQEYVEKLGKLEEAVKAEDHTYAKKLCDELLAMYPDMVSVQYYSYVLEGVETVYEAYKKRYGSSNAVEQFRKDSMEECLEVFVVEIAEAKGDLDRAYHGYRALKNTAKAKYIRYQQGEKALKAGHYATALGYFAQAEDYRDAEQQARYLRRAVQVKPEFDKHVGNGKTFFERRLTEELPEQMTQYKALKKQRDDCKYTYNEDTIYYVGILVMMVTCIIMLFDDAECNMVWPYFAWGIAGTIALHNACVWDFRLILSSLCAFAMSCAIPFSKILAEQYLGTYWIAMLAALAVTVFFFIRAIQRIFGYRKYQKINAAMDSIKNNYLHNHQERIRSELIAQYKPEVGETIIKQWMDNLETFC